MERVPTWHNQGIDIRGKKTVEEVLNEAGLNFTVTKRALSYRVGGQHYRAENKMAVVKDTDPNRLYGIVSNGYAPVQNEEAFDFINCISDEIEFLRAGETRNGYIYIIARMPEITVLGDAVRPHLIFQNGHNGEIPLQANICLLRIVCENQFTYSFKNAANAIKIRHCGDMGEKLATARETILKTQEYIQNFQDLAGTFAGKKISDSVLQEIIKQMVIEHRTEEAAEERVGIFLNAYNAPDNANFRGTAYGVLNAFTDFTTHLPAMKASDTYEESRFIKTTFKPREMNKMVKLLDRVA